MGAEVWGTLAVNDHLCLGALLRELLVFDRLVVPVPDSRAERYRWKHPNPDDPNETWDPDALDRVLALLGTQRQPSAGGAALAWESDWSARRWQSEKSRGEIAATITEADAFYATRLILSMDEKLPTAIEAIAAYPSERAFLAEVAPAPEPPKDLTAADALILLARPLLVPDVSDGDYERALTEAAKLARSPLVREERARYHDFLRQFVSRLRRPGADLKDIRLDLASLDLARSQLEGLHNELRREVAGDSRRKRWSKVETVLTAFGAAGTVGLAFEDVSAAIGAGGAMLGFIGWVAGKRAETPQPRPLNGASLFVTAPEQLTFLRQTPLPAN